MTTGLTVRSCRPDECAAVLDLWQRAEATPSVTDDLPELQRLVRDPRALLLLAERDGRLAGSVIGGWDGWRGNVYRLAVAPEWRRQGIGRALVRDVTRRLAAQGARRITALVEREHPDAMAFWDAMTAEGYLRDPRMARYVGTVE